MKIIDIPKDEKVENIKQNTPTGESQIIKFTMFKIISFRSMKNVLTLEVSFEILFTP